MLPLKRGSRGRHDTTGMLATFYGGDGGENRWGPLFIPHRGRKTFLYEASMCAGWAGLLLGHPIESRLCQPVLPSRGSS